MEVRLKESPKKRPSRIESKRRETLWRKGGTPKELVSPTPKWKAKPRNKKVKFPKCC